MNCVFILVQLLKPPRKALAENLGPFKPTCLKTIYKVSNWDGGRGGGGGGAGGGT